VEGKSTQVEQLLKTKTAITALKDEYGFTPLHYAIRANQPQMIKLLLERGCNAVNDNYNADYITPLELGYLYATEEVSLLWKHSFLPAKQHIPRTDTLGSGSEEVAVPGPIYSQQGLDDLTAYLRSKKRWRHVVHCLGVVSLISKVTDGMLDTFTAKEEASGPGLASNEAKDRTLAQKNKDEAGVAEEAKLRQEELVANQHRIQQHATEAHADKLVKKGQTNAARKKADEAAVKLTGSSNGGKPIHLPYREAVGTLTQDQQKKIEEVFHAIDFDNNGFVTVGELRQAVNMKLLYSGLGLPDASRDLKQTCRFFEEIDDDGSGRLDCREFGELCQRLIHRANTKLEGSTTESQGGAYNKAKQEYALKGAKVEAGVTQAPAIAPQSNRGANPFDAGPVTPPAHDPWGGINSLLVTGPGENMQYAACAFEGWEETAGWNPPVPHQDRLAEPLSPELAKEAEAVFRFVAGEDAMMSKAELLKAMDGDFGTFAQLDSDRNGHVNLEEWDLYLRKMVAEKGAENPEKGKKWSLTLFKTLRRAVP